MELVIPSAEYKDSYLESVREFRANGDYQPYREADFALAEKDFSALLNKLDDNSHGKNLPEGYVPATEFWLVDEGEYIGRLSLRHTLNEHLRHIGGHIGYDIRPSKRRQGYGKRILELGLVKAKEMGIDKILLTCDVSNEPSRKIIEGAGGVLENVVPAGEGQPDKNRFWIDL